MGDKLYRVESAVKVTVKKGNPFIKTQLRDVTTGDILEKNFKLEQSIDEIQLKDSDLEFLYLDGDAYVFLENSNLDLVRVPLEIVGEKVHYLKEGIEVKGTFHGEEVFAVELPQFVELMVKSTDEAEEAPAGANVLKKAVLETGAELEVPGFVEAGDLIKVDTRTREYIQRV